MIGKVISFVLSYYIFIGIAVVAVGILVAFLLIKKRQQDQAAWEIQLRTDNLLDKSSLKRSYLNTNSLGKKLSEVTRQVIHAQYAQDPTSLPVDSLDYTLYMQIYNELKREYDLGIKNTIIAFDMPDSSVVEQTSDSLSVITHLIVESFFEITYTTFHVSFGQKEDNKAYKQRFVFFNQSGQWLLSSIEAPEAATDYEWDLVHQKKQKQAN